MLKVAFFQKVRFAFQISKSPKKITPNHYPELEIWISCLLLWAGISNPKFRIVIWSIFFWDLEIWKANRTFWIKATFNNGKYKIHTVIQNLLKHVTFMLCRLATFNKCWITMFIFDFPVSLTLEMVIYVRSHLNFQIL